MGFDEYDYLEKNMDGDDDISFTLSKPEEEEVLNQTRSKYHNKTATTTTYTGLDDRSSKKTRYESRDVERVSSRKNRSSPIRDDVDDDNDNDKRSRSRDRDRTKSSSRRRHRDDEENKGKDRDQDRNHDKKVSKRDVDKHHEESSNHERETNRRRRSRSQSERHRNREKGSNNREVEHMEMEYKERPHDIRFGKSKKEETEVEVDPERDQRTVFAYQITQKADKRDIFEFFSRAGKVRDVRLVMDRKSGRSRGVGYVEFVNAMSVPMAISLSGQPLLGTPVMVKPSEAEKNLVQPTVSTMNGSVMAGSYPGGARRLYVSNLHLNMKDYQLRQIFEAFGTVEMVQLPTSPDTGHCKGFGFVQFARLEDAKAAEGLNGQLEIAGHLIKVSAVADQILLATGVNTGDFDDDGYGDLALNGSSRALLMQKLDRSSTFVNPLVQASIPASLLAPPVSVPCYDLIGFPSECLLLKNMFDPKIETETNFELDIKEDTKEECSKFGTLRHIYVDKNSAGFVYLRFEITEAAMSAQRALHGRWFAGKMITATFMVLRDYEAKFPDSR